MGVSKKGTCVCLSLSQEPEPEAKRPPSRGARPLLLKRGEAEAGRGQEFTARFDSQAICGYCGEWGIAVKVSTMGIRCSVRYVRALNRPRGVCVLHKDGSTAPLSPGETFCGTVPAALRRKLTA
jgi:hypothetical protein